MLYISADSCDSECTFGHLCCTALTLAAMLSIQESVYAVHSIAITCDTECTCGCSCCTALTLSVMLSIEVGVYAVQHSHYL